MRTAAPVLALASALFHTPAFAARPFITDDARIVDPGGCQIESFARNQRKSSENEFWFLPGCTPGSNVEYTLGGFKLDNAESGTSSTVIAQAKTLLRPLAVNGYGLALTLGLMHLNQADTLSGARWNPFVNFIGSKSLLGDALVLHANAGTLHDRNADRTRHTWGIGSEIRLSPQIHAIAEAYQQEGELPSRQIGLRYWIIPNRFQADGTVGSQNVSTGNRAWTSLGMRLLF